MKILFSDQIKQGAPQLRVLAIMAKIHNKPTSSELWSEILEQGELLKSSVKLENVNKLPGIAPTRKAYKACGKEPNRYRPSAEALTRRVVKGMELYRTLMAIDLINLLSLRSGHSIGGFDADKIDGDTLTLGVGREGEPFEAIGRGTLNITGLPAYRDSIGAIGTPTSDCERTKLSEDTANLLMLVNVYDAETDIVALSQEAMDLLKKYGATIESLQICKP